MFGGVKILHYLKWDRQPFAMTLNSLPVPAVTDIANNLIFADYDGVKAL